MTMLRTMAHKLELPTNASEETMKACWNLEYEQLTTRQTESIAKLGYAWYRLRNKCNAHSYNDNDKREMLMEMWETSMKRAEEVRNRRSRHTK